MASKNVLVGTWKPQEQSATPSSQPRAQGPEPQELLTQLQNGYTAPKQEYTDEQKRAALRDSRWNVIANYHDSNESNYELTKRYQQEAEDYFNEATNNGDQQEAGHWRSLADALQDRSFVDNNVRKQDNRARYDELDKTAQNYANALRSGDSAVIGGMSFTARYGMSQSQMRQALADARNQQKHLDEEYATYGDNTNQQRDEAIARQKIGSREYRRLAKEQLDGMREELSTIDQSISEAGSEEEAQALRQRKAELSSYMMQWGPEDLATKLYNDDKQFLKDFDEQWNNGEKVYTGMDYANKVINSFGERTAGAGANLLALGARGLDYSIGANSNPELLAEYARSQDPEFQDQTGTPATDAYNKQWNEASRYNPETGEYGAGNETFAARAAGGLEAIADRLDTQSQKDLQMAKDAATKKYGWLGGFATDITSTALDIGFDTITGGGLATMAARVAGSGFGEARRQGATAGQQFAYGASKAAIEVATEKLGDGLAIVYGKGVSGDIVEKAIGKLAKTDMGANFLRLLAGTISEGGEEVISDLLDPFTQWIISEEARNKGYWAQLDPSDILYDFLLGAAMGFGGSAIEAGTGGYQAKNVEQTNAMREDLDNTLPLSQRELDAYNKSEKQLADRLTNREENEVRTALKKAGIKGEGLDSAVSELTHTGKSTARDRRDTIIRNARAEGVGLTDRETTLREEEEMLRNYDDEEAPPERTKGGDAWADNEALREAPKSSRGDTIAREGETVAEEGEAAVGLKESAGYKDLSAEKKADVKNVVSKLQTAVSDGRVGKVPVGSVSGSAFKKAGPEKLTDTVGAFFEKLGGKVKSKALGGQEVILNERGVKSDIAHGVGRAKAATFAAVPAVIEKGNLIDEQTNWKGRGYDTKIIAGRVLIDGKLAYVGCVVSVDNSDGNNRFYLHEVVDENGDLIFSLDSMGRGNKKAPTANIKTGVAENSDTGVAAEASDNSISQEPSTSKAENGTIGSERSDLRYERELNTNSNSKPGKVNEEAVKAEQGGKSELRSKDVSLASRAPVFTGKDAERLTAVWHSVADDLRIDGYAVVSEKEATKWMSKDTISAINKIAKIADVPVTYFSDQSPSSRYYFQNGFVINGEPGVGLFINTGAVDVSETTFHEAMHILWAKRGEGISRKSTIVDAFKRSNIDVKTAQNLAYSVLDLYGYTYGNFPGVDTPEQWSKIPSGMQVDLLDSLPDAEKEVAIERMYEEVCNWLVTEDYMALRMFDIGTTPTEIRNILSEKGILTDDEFKSILDAIADAQIASLFGKTVDEETAEIKSDEADVQSAEKMDSTPEEDDTEGQRPEPTGKRKGHKKGLEEKTQTRGAQRHHDSWMTEVGKKYNTDNGTFVSYTRAEVSRIADYCIDKFGVEEERERLMDKKDWNRVDFSEAGKIVYQMTVKLNRDMSNGARGLGPILERMAGESAKEYDERQKVSDNEAYKARREPIDALLQAYAEQKSEAGQRLQEEYKFSTADDIRMRATQRFLNFSQNGQFSNATEGSKSAKMWRIMDDLLARAEAAETAGNKGDLVELTRMVSRIRSRDNMFGKSGVKAEKFLFDRMLKGGLDSEKLAALAYGNISKIMDDLMPITYADAIESVRMNNMLSNFATGINNLVNNAAALRTQAIAQNAAIPFAKQFEKITGKKVAVRDTSWRRSKAIVRAEEVAYEYAVLSAYYGINAEDGRIDTKKNGGAGFSLTGTGASGMVGRALARYSFFVNSLVLSPDAPAKARARLGLQQGIEEAFKDADMSDPAVIKNMKELEAFANNEALRRTLQDDNKYTNFVKSVKTKLLGDIKTPGENIEIKGRKLGSFDLGSFMIAFAKVPTNVGIQKVAATPYGALYQVARYANGLIKAKANPESMTATEMAKLSRDVGRACTTVGMIGLGAIGAMTGALKNFDDTDDEEEKKLAAEKGYKGLTFNLSAIFHGGEWRDGDTVISGNFLEILATPLAIGAIMYDAMQEGASLPQAIHYGTVESFTQIVDAVTEIPGLQQVGQLYESFVNRDPNENDMKGMLKAVGQFAVNTGTSYFVPNLVSQTTAGVDNKQRDIYTTNSYAETLRNIVMSKTPGLRQMLPEKTDTFGNTRTYGDSPIMAVINTVLLPGDIRKYHVSDLEKELLRLNAAGYKSTWFDTKGPKNISVGDNEYGLTADERRAYHMTKARYLVEAYDEFRTSDEYKNLDDAQKAAVYKALRLDAERMTKNECLEAAGIEARATMDKWETEFDSWRDKINYLAAKQQALASWDTDENAVSDYASMDAFIKNDYGKLDKKTKDLLNNSLSHLDDLYEASKVGISSENWQKCYDIYREYNATDEEGHKVYKANMTNESEMWARMQAETGLTDNQMRHIEDNMELRTMISPDTEQYYEYLDDAGLTRDEAKVTIRKMSELQPATGYTSVQNSQKYLVIVDTVPKAKQWDAFWTIVPSNASKNKVKTLREDQRKGVSLATALQHVGWNIVKTK